MNITEFLEARIAEEELDARRLYLDLEAEIAESYPAADDKGPFTPERLLSAQMWAHYDGQSKRRSFAKGQQIAKLANPARVLAECAAKRAIIAECRQSTLDDLSGGDDDQPVPMWVARALAAVYADHPDYQQEWAG